MKFRIGKIKKLARYPAVIFLTPVVLLLISCVSNDEIALEGIPIKDHGEYEYLDISVLPSQQDFYESYQLGINTRQSWVQSPALIGLMFVGSTYNLAHGESSGFVEELYVVGTSNSNATVIIVDNPTGLNDSYSGYEIRIDLVYEDVVWLIQWFGIRSLCNRIGNTGWVVGMCP